MTPLLLALVGLLAGPTLHHIGVRAGVRAPFEGIGPRCETCGAVRMPLAVRCPDGHPTRGREPAIWVLSGSLFAAAGVVAAHEPWLLPAHIVLAAMSVVLFITDLDHKLIPNRVLYPSTALIAVLVVVGAVGEGRTNDLPRAGLGAVGYFGVLLVVYLVARGGFGFGDVKLALVLGGITAFASQRVLLLAVFFTGVIGGIPAIWLLVTRKARGGDELPYGPPMLAGAWAALVFGEAFGRLIT